MMRSLIEMMELSGEWPFSSTDQNRDLGVAHPGDHPVVARARHAVFQPAARRSTRASPGFDGGHSRRVYAAAFRHERQSAWLGGIEGAFRHFGGLPGELLLDNAHALVKRHDAATREVEFTDRLHAFVRYWDVRPVACAPYRARTKGKDERGVGYIQAQRHRWTVLCLLGRAGGAPGLWWMREVADARVHGTIGEAPIARFERDEAAALRP